MEIEKALNKYVLFLPTMGTASETTSVLGHHEYYDSLVKSYKENGYLKIDNSLSGSLVFISDIKFLVVFTQQGYSNFKYEQQRNAAMQQGAPRIIGG